MSGVLSGVVPFIDETHAAPIVLPQSAAAHDRILSALPDLRVDDQGEIRSGETPVVFSADSRRSIEAAQAKRARKASRPQGA